MLGNFESEIQTARHIAGNRSDRLQLIVILGMLACAIITVLLSIFTPLRLSSAAPLAICMVAICVIPSAVWNMRRHADEAAKLNQMREDQLQEHRAGQADKL